MQNAMRAKGDIFDEIWGVDNDNDDAFMAIVVCALGIGALLYWLFS